MPEKRLRPIYDKDSLSDKVFEEIDYYFYDLIYKPLLDLMREETGIKVNSKASAISALAAGRIQYRDGFFYGQFSAGISKYLRSLGAEFNHVKKAFKLDPEQIPQELKLAIQASNAKSLAVVDAIRQKIDEIERNAKQITKPVALKDPSAHIFRDLDKQFEATTSADFAIKPEIPPKMRETLEREYGQNLDLYIKKWEEEAIFRLRDQVEKNVVQGFRSDSMVERIKAEYGVSQNKARFLARQETSLLVSKYREERYKDIGIGKYQWSTSSDVRVRHDHKELNGRIFSWNNPPITDQATGARNNPGEDYNCRCVAIPVFDEPWEKKVK